MSSLIPEITTAKPRRVSDRTPLRDLAARVSPRVAAMCRAVAEQGLANEDAWRAARAHAVSDDAARALWDRTVANPAAANLLQRMRRNEALRLSMTPGALIDDALTLFDDSEDDRVRLACLKLVADLLPAPAAESATDATGGSDPAYVVAEIMASYFGRTVDLPPPRRTVQGELVASEA